MDSITHIALGACIGEAALSKQIGKKALILGAIAQSLPDIDVIASLWLPPTENLVVHRGLTHSFLFGVAAAILLSVIVQRIFRLKDLSFLKLFIFFCMQLWLHDLLDTCNAYGTGLFEPFSHRRFSFQLLFVVDPFFSFSLVMAFVVLAFLQKDSTARKRWLIVGLLPASFYLFYAIYNKTAVQEPVKKSLTDDHIAYNDILITPTPFNTWLWYIVAATDSGYFIGYCSVFDRKNLPTQFTYYPKNQHLLQAVDETMDVKGLVRFSDGYYTVAPVDSALVFNVLRFGQVLGWQDPKARFAFQYFLRSDYDNTFVVQRGRFKGWNRETIIRMYHRIKGD